MSATITAEEIKETRGKYQLSQKAFADLLGIGSASIARYERGAEPSKANANLIRAAAHPEFMMECIERDGDCLSATQRDNVMRVCYAYVSLPSEDEVAASDASEMNAIYDLTLQQEVLNEQAANLACDLMRYMLAAGIDARDLSNPVSALLDKVFEVKRLFFTQEGDDQKVIDGARGFLKYASEIVNGINDCAEVA